MLFAFRKRINEASLQLLIILSKVCAMKALKDELFNRTVCKMKAT